MQKLDRISTSSIRPTSCASTTKVSKTPDWKHFLKIWSSVRHNVRRGKAAFAQITHIYVNVLLRISAAYFCRSFIYWDNIYIKKKPGNLICFHLHSALGHWESLQSDVKGTTCVLLWWNVLCKSYFPSCARRLIPGCVAYSHFGHV